MFTLRNRRMVAVATTLPVAAVLTSAPQAAARVSQSAAAVIPDMPACISCYVEVDEELTLVVAGDTMRGAPHAVVLDGHERYWVFRRDDVPIVFDSTGRLVATVGTYGVAPGSYIRPYTALFLPGDSVLIPDALAHRATVLAPSLEPARYIDLALPFQSPVVVSWPHKVVASGSLPTPEAVGWPLHEISLSGGRAHVVRSFGPGDATLKPAEVTLLGQALAPAAEGGIWSVTTNAYEIQLWDSTANLKKAYLRKPPWFVPRSPRGVDWRSEPPPSGVAAITEDSEGYLRVFVHVASPTWQAAFEAVPEDVNEIPQHLVRLGKLYDTILEILDPVRGRVVTRFRFRGYALGPLPGNRVALYREPARGEYAVEVVRAELIRP